jgi:hypothetical protein
VITCLSCGHVFKPGEGATEADFDKKHQIAIEKQESNKSSRQGIRIFAFVILVVIIAVMWGTCNSLRSQSDAEQSVNNETNSTPSTNKVKYIVISQKANFYKIGTNNGLWHKRRAFLVIGEKIDSVNEKAGYMYCVFTDSITQKITKGWISSTDIRKLSDTTGVSSN